MTDTDLRVEVAAQALANASKHSHPYGGIRPGPARVNDGHRWKARDIVAALDAYDREHPPTCANPLHAEENIRARIAADILAKGHGDGFHRERLSQDDAGAYCALCSVVGMAARVAREGP